MGGQDFVFFISSVYRWLGGPLSTRKTCQNGNERMAISWEIQFLQLENLPHLQTNQLLVPNLRQHHLKPHSQAKNKLTKTKVHLVGELQYLTGSCRFIDIVQIDIHRRLSWIINVAVSVG